MKPFQVKFFEVKGSIEITYSDFLSQKYLFYEGKLYEHMPILNNKSRKYTFIIPIGQKGGEHVLIQECHLAKPYLTSRINFKVNDRVFDANGMEGRIEDAEDLHNIKVKYTHGTGLHCVVTGCDDEDFDLYKIFGEISSDANWIVEGTELGEDEVHYCEPLKDGTVESYKVKGCCGHFH